ncbi:hypothetical protein ACFT5B_14240 [Luteimicrobium sp. NPDC057192]|uniref:hypothetical protein n=1 Tax=Luteimicrobium sp. NPDC057192 TaxID=3346042 RepID=UPI003642B4B7
MSRPTPNASWSAPSLMTSLSNAGWGELNGRSMQGVRSVLHGLVAQLPHRSAAGKATVMDIADRAGLSMKWTARCLHLLEDLGVIEWTRGGITIESASKRHGTPGWIRIVKHKLVELIFAARPWHDERLAQHRAETLRRIMTIKTRYTRTKLRNDKRSRRSHHVELSAHPTPLRGGSGGTPPRVGDPEQTQALQEPAARALIEGPDALGGVVTRAGRAIYNRDECDHGWPVGQRKRDGRLTCPDCRRAEQ